MFLGILKYLWPIWSVNSRFYLFLCLSTSVSLALSDMLMLSILIGDETEPSTDEKTMLAATHGFLPGALRGVLQALSEFTGFSPSVVLHAVLTVSSWFRLLSSDRMATLA